ncbi:FtsQ-type POTRA domain-containing protein [Kineosporia sp. J2-2]|uniref:FtsQ-type POTRA domain-containing protein n=1 Tax=Kineosporia corallincola TaxID=2835133 RepID=A0ABS5TJ32_9ACTN|nr:FtsQ-type POTRA domain-containing protein [Kineosporia corallincola]MBT0771087.1 FtsQ-type POTRA domain-containing protein [Kineosporia corallincola]
MSPSTSSSGPGRRPGRSSSGRATASGRGAAARRQPASPSSPKSSPRASSGKNGKKKPRPKVTASRSAGLLERPVLRSGRPVVSPTSAQRFAARARRRRLRRTMTVLSAMMVLAGGGWLAFLSPWAKVERVEVSGLDRISESQVRDVAETEIGHSMLLARTADITAQVEKLRLVKDVTVSRSWPGTIAVDVTEREPVAALPSEQVAANSHGTGSGDAATGTAKPVQMVQLVDDDGVVIETVPAADAPAALPRIQVTLGEKRSVENLRGTLAVLNGLPENLSSRLRSIGTSSPDGIWLKLRLTGNRTVTVQWGDSEQGDQKARVLTALLKQKAKTYDVRAPEMPTVSS